MLGPAHLIDQEAAGGGPTTIDFSPKISGFEKPFQERFSRMSTDNGPHPRIILVSDRISNVILYKKFPTTPELCTS
jgi:hypothetical protein